jgi:hypothetical protein
LFDNAVLATLAANDRFDFRAVIAFAQAALSRSELQIVGV